jgi:hypothetical protein
VKFLFNQKQNEKQNEKLSVRGCSGIGTKKIKKIKKNINIKNEKQNIKKIKINKKNIN